MSNRRSGSRGGNRFSQPFSSINVNPWQGSSNALNQSGIISQLTTNPQIALALSSLLQTQQQQPPSLLSLNTSGYSDSRDLGRFGGARSRNFRRHEPYTKDRGGWRTDKRGKKSQNERKKDDKKVETKKEHKEKNDSKEKTKDNFDFLEDSIDEESKETKRDWKDEKNQAEGKDDAEEEIKTPPKEPKAKEGKFAGVPAKYLNCFICNKQMWDGESMGKHLKGRAHHEMLKALEESIHICVNILRENMRLAEERKVIELNRQNRLRKYGDRKHFGETSSHCNMCDLKFMGKIVIHRRSNDHQRLKRYLHPTCRICEKEFPSRVEWIEHRLTPDHLLKVHEISEKSAGGKDGNEIIEGNEDLVNEDNRKKEEVSECDPDTETNTEMQDLDLEPLLEEPLQMENENPILELDDALDSLQNRIPAYKRERPVSVKSLQPFTGFVCNLCHKSFIDEQDAQDHLKTRKHYYNFIEALREQFERNERRAKKAEKVAKEEAENIEAMQTSQENGEQEDEGEDGEERQKDNEDVELYDPAIHTSSNVDDDEVNNTQLNEGDDYEAPILVEDEDEDEAEAGPSPIDTSVVTDSTKDTDSAPPVDDSVNDTDLGHPHSDSANDSDTGPVPVEPVPSPKPTPVPAPVPSPITERPKPQLKLLNKPKPAQAKPAAKLQTPQKAPQQQQQQQQQQTRQAATPKGPTTPAVVSTPVPTAAAVKLTAKQQAMQKKSNVKNGAGPKSKRGRRI